jgi:hypothetical protein
MRQSHIYVGWTLPSGVAGTRYSQAMLYRVLLVVAWCLACAAAWAQVAVPRALEPESTPTREQRRAELRTMLQAHRQWDGAATARDATPVERHLTELERAEIRQQLREQRSEKARIRP